MRLTTQNLLIIGGLAIVGYIVYKKFSTPARVAPSPVVHSTTGSGNSVSAATGQGSGGSTDFWHQLGSAGQGLNSAVSSVESTYNSVYDLFGGGDTSTNTGQGNNGTAG